MYFMCGKYLSVCSWKAENTNKYLLFGHLLAFLCSGENSLYVRDSVQTETR